MTWAEVVNNILKNPVTILQVIVSAVTVIILAKYTGLEFGKGRIFFNHKRRDADIRTQQLVSIPKDLTNYVDKETCNILHHSINEELQFISKELLKVRFYSETSIQRSIEAGLWYLKKKGNHITAEDIHLKIKENPEEYALVCAREPDLRIFNL